MTQASQLKYRYPRRVVLRYILRQLMRPLVRLLCDFEVENPEALPQKGPYLVVSNHFHFLDAPFMIHATRPWPIEFLAGSNFVEPPFYVKWLPSVWGIYEVIRGGASREAIRAARDVLAQDGFICIYPEAGAWAPVLKYARPGAALVAVQSGAPVLPIGIHGVTEVLSNFKEGKRAKVIVRVGEPFGPFTAEGRGRQRREQLEQIGETMMRHIAALLPPEKRGVFSDDPVVRAEAEKVADYPFHDWMG